MPTDVAAAFHYNGTFGLSQDVNGNTVGTFAGNLTGLYAGLPVNVAFLGGLQPVPPDAADPDLDGKGTGNFGPDTVDVTVHVKTDDAKNTAKVTGKFNGQDISDGDDIKKTHDDKKKQTTYEGGITIRGFSELLTIVINDEKDKDNKQPFTGRIESKTFTSDIKGTFTLAANQPPPPGQNFDIAFDVHVGPGASAVPEPTALTLLGTAALCLLGYSRWRRNWPASS